MLVLIAALVAWWGGSFLFMWGLCVAASGRPPFVGAEPARVPVRVSDDPAFLPS